MRAEQFLVLLANDLRIGAALQWAISVFWIGRSGPQISRTWVVVIFAVGFIGYLLVPLPFSFGAPIEVSLFFLVATYLTVPFIWIASSALFQDGFG